MTTAGLIGNTINVVGPATIWHVGVHRLGVAILEESFRWAAVGMCGATTTRATAKRVQEAVLFLQGTALDVTLETFGLNYQADELRDAFTAWLQQRKTPYYP